METRNEGSGGPGSDEVDTANDQLAAKRSDAEKREAAERAERERLLAENPNELSATDILNVTDDVVTEWVPVPEWKGRVLVRSLSGTERDAFEASIVKVRGKVREQNLENIRAKLVQATVCDPKDPTKLLFTKKNIDALGKRSAAALDRIYDVSARLSGLTQKDVEELAGNSAAAGGGDS